MAIKLCLIKAPTKSDFVANGKDKGFNSRISCYEAIEFDHKVSI
ncbi:hypothetical protein CCACVL1_06747 [Corchorus capsularis]|uniref:Uncharacterized protein n=1 Tax=Corchorus capsularis TaxID=210143 RepID=A0A1R3JD74_COCAP|nr:hypothetical protein CCACVL1_06747 [Corchorus capsularis]